MRRRMLLVAACAFILPTGIHAQEQNFERQISQFLFSPNIIREMQGSLDLSENQTSAIWDMTLEFEATTNPLEWDLEGKIQDLLLLLDVEQIDVSRTMALFDEVLELETRIKRTHMHLLLELRNLLNSEQRSVLEHHMQFLLQRGARGEGREGGEFD